MMCLRILHEMLVSEMGRQLSGNDLLPFLKIA